MKRRGIWRMVLVCAGVACMVSLCGTAVVRRCLAAEQAETDAEMRSVPVLMYHQFAEEAGDYTTTGTVFREHLEALRSAGYEAVTFAKLLAFVREEGELPEKPVILLADDGYTGVLDTALPLLAEYDMCMSTAVIGDRLGVWEDGGLAHFSLEELAAADPDGRLEAVSHSWGLHGVEDGMRGAVNVTWEWTAYAERIAGDCDRMRTLGGEAYPMMGQVFVYPYGSWSADSEALLACEGIAVTVTTDVGIARAVRGETLTLLPRIPAEWYKSGEALLKAIGKEGG